MSPRPKCHPECDEMHHLDCPVFEWEAEYWARYFGLQSGTDAATKAHNKRQLEAFAPVGTVRDLEGE